MLPVWFLTSRSPDWFAGRGRPPQAAARRAGLEFVEKLSQRSSPVRVLRALLSRLGGQLCCGSCAWSSNATAMPPGPGQPPVGPCLASSLQASGLAG
jgi:hypothetical protein